MRKLLFGLAAGATMLAASTPAEAQITFSYASDAAFGALGFTKQFGGNVRAGNNFVTGSNPLAGDWEAAVVNGSDAPIGANQQYNFGADANDGVAGHASTFSLAGSMATLGVGSSSLTRAVNAVGINTLVIRARASNGAAASLSDLFISIIGGPTNVSLASLIGDGNAEYLVIQDARLANGFTITGTGLIAGPRNAGSDPMYQFKVGTAPAVVPEPISMALLGSGLAGMGGIGAFRRRRQQSDA